MIDGRGDEPVLTDGPFVETKAWARLPTSTPP